MGFRTHPDLFSWFYLTCKVRRMKKRMIIVGNAPLPHRRAERIDGADFVMRFNEPSQDASVIGTRTDLLLLATSSKAMRRWLSGPDYLNSPIVRNTPEILCPLHPAIIRRYHPQPNFLSRLRGRRADWTVAAIETFGQCGKKVSVLPAQDYLAACDALAIPEPQRRRVFPSTGFIGIWLALRDFAAEAWEIELCGFAWQGWKRHAWEVEQLWITRQVEEGRLTLQE